MTPNTNDILTRLADSIQNEADRLCSTGSGPDYALAESLENIAASIRGTAPLPVSAVHLASPEGWAQLAGLCGSTTGPFTSSSRQATCAECLRENERGAHPHGYQVAGDFLKDTNMDLGRCDEHGPALGCWRCCRNCNYDTHSCPGCGVPLPHGTPTCAECRKL